MDSKVEEEKILTRKRIQIGYFSYHVEKFIKPPTQCYKCSKFGHIAKVCQNEAVCSKCASSNHLQKFCVANKPKCANCGDSHHAFDKSCHAYREAKKVSTLRLNSSKTKTSSISAQNDKSYVNVASSDQKDIIRRFDKLDFVLEKITDKMESTDKKLDSFRKEVTEEISHFTVSNNKRLAGCMIESIKIMHANNFSDNDKVQKMLVKCFEGYCLGDEIPLFKEYDSKDISKDSRFHKLGLANKKNIFSDAKSSCL